MTGKRLLAMAPPALLVLAMAVATATGPLSASEENELDYGSWNYREGGKSKASLSSFAVL